MAESACKQMINTVVRRSRTQSLRVATTFRDNQRFATTFATAAPRPHEDEDSTTPQWQEHRLSPSSNPTSKSRIATLRNDPEPRTFSSFLTDNYARQHNYLRISVTERCNLRCLYCMPEEGIQLSPPEHNLTTPEIVYLSELFVKQGVNKIRLTGGEPTVRKDIVSLMQQIGQLRSLGLKELCITTNGISLHRKLDSMVESGLTAVNLSLDTLDPFQFTLMTRRNGHDAVMKSINRILEMNRLGAGIKLKINCVVMKGLNEREIIPFVELGKEKDLEVRFIEYMPFDGNKWSENKMLPYNEMLALIRTKYPDVYRMHDHANDTSKTYKISGFTGRIGFITSMTHNFCGSCNRLRITSDGNLKVCLFGNSEVSLRDVLRESNSGKPFDVEAMEALKQLESNRREARSGGLGISEREAQLLDIIGMAVKRKREKHAGIGELENMKNRPMILIDKPLPINPSPALRMSSSQSIASLLSVQSRSAMYSSPQTALPLHLLSHPRHFITTQQLRHRSTFLGRRTYRSDQSDNTKRVVRYFMAPAKARYYVSVRAEHPTRIKSTRMQRQTAHIRTRLQQCRMAFHSRPTGKSERASMKGPIKQGGAQTAGAEQPLTHLDDHGAAHMVEISNKLPTKRAATAVATLFFSDKRTYDALASQRIIKGNAIAVARLAAIQAAKKTSDLVPLAHPSLGITGINVEIEAFGPGPDEKTYRYQSLRNRQMVSTLNCNLGHVTVTATVTCEGKTGVEMEAITAATIGTVTMYDMLKAIDKGMVIMGARVVSKEGGKSGSWKWDDKANQVVKVSTSATTSNDDKAQSLDQPPQENISISNESRPNMTQTAQSDIDEWNRGLSNEFSVSGSSQAVTDDKSIDKTTISSSTNAKRHSTPRLRPILKGKKGTQPVLNRSPNQSTKPKKSNLSQPAPRNSISSRSQTQAQSKSRSPRSPNQDSISNILSAVRTLESRLLAIQKSQYIASVANQPAAAQQAADREAKLDTAEEWNVHTMSPIERGDLSNNEETVDAKGMRDAARKRFEKEGTGQGSIMK